jgi:Family of unknown function (DUF6355)
MSRHGQSRPGVVTALVAAALTAVAVLGGGAQAPAGPPVVAAPIVPVALRCGYDVDPALGQAYYTHCDERSRVMVYIKARTGMIAEACFGPGTHHLGTTDVVRFAYYAGWVC